MVRRTLSTLLPLVLSCLAAGTIEAKKNDPRVDLQYVPQQNVNHVNVPLDSELRAEPVAFAIVDGRGLDDPAFIGTRTNDADREFDLTATGEVVPFLDETIAGMLREWGLTLDDDAPTRLELEVLQYRVRETNQAVGATFESEVRLGCRLSRAGRQLWAGKTSGGAKRYGKKFSNPNVNEVLSDGLLETVAELMSTRSLQAAWVEPPAPDVEVATGEASVVSPDRLLEDLRRLMSSEFESATILEYLDGKTLSRALNADELVALKSSGVSEDVIRTVIKLPVR